MPIYPDGGGWPGGWVQIGPDASTVNNWLRARSTVMVRPAAEDALTQHVATETNYVTDGAAWGAPHAPALLVLRRDATRQYTVFTYSGYIKLFRQVHGGGALGTAEIDANIGAWPVYDQTRRYRTEAWAFGTNPVIIRVDITDLATGARVFTGSYTDASVDRVQTASAAGAGGFSNEDFVYETVAYDNALPPLRAGVPQANGVTGAVNIATSAANGTAGPYTNQWQRKVAGAPATSWANLSGATGLSFSDTTGVVGTDYDYRAVQGDGLGQSVNTATVTAGPLANIPILSEGIPNWLGSEAASLYTHQATQSGRWEDAATWGGAAPPTFAGGSVAKIPTGLTVTTRAADSGFFTAVAGGASLVVDALASKSGRFHTIYLGDLVGGVQSRLQLGGASRTAPLPFSRSHTLDLGGGRLPAAFGDAKQVGGGIVGFGLLPGYGGRKNRWTRATADLTAEQTVIPVKSARGWQVGDTVSFADTTSPRVRLLVELRTDSHSATRTIASVASDRKSITLTSGLPWDYEGSEAKLDNSGVPIAGTRRFTIVQNLSSNVTLQSADTSQTKNRAHVMLAGPGQCDTDNIALLNLGRTTNSPLDNTTGANQVGRYTWHFHHCNGEIITPLPGGYRSRVTNCASVGGLKWGYTIHLSTALLLQNCAVYDTGGAGVMVEDPASAYCDVFACSAVKIYGGLTGANLGLALDEAGNQPRRAVNKSDIAWEGTGFWASGHMVRWVGNVAGDAGAAGLVIQAFFQGTDTYPFPADQAFGPADVKTLPYASWTALQFPARHAYLFEQGEEVYRDTEAFGCARGVLFFDSAPLTLKNTLCWNNYISIHCPHTDVWHARVGDLRGDVRTAAGSPDLATLALTVGGGIYADRFNQGVGFLNNAFRVLYDAADLHIQSHDVGVLSGTPLGATGKGPLDGLPPLVPSRETGVEINLFVSRVVVLTPAGKVSFVLAFDHHYGRRRNTKAKVYLRDCKALPQTPGDTNYVQIVLQDIFGSDVDAATGFQCYAIRYNGRTDTLQLFSPNQEPGAKVPASSNRDAAGALKNWTDADAADAGTTGYAGEPIGSPMRFGAGKRLYPASEGFDDVQRFRIGGIPEPGLTNAQSLASYGLCWDGEITPPSATVQAGMVGINAIGANLPVKGLVVPAPPADWKDRPHLYTSNVTVTAGAIILVVAKTVDNVYRSGTQSGTPTGEMRGVWRFRVYCDGVAIPGVYTADSVSSNRRTALFLGNPPWPAAKRDGQAHAIQIRDTISGIYVRPDADPLSPSEVGQPSYSFSVVIPIP